MTHNKEVIKSASEPTEWKFWDFTHSDNNPIEDWYKTLSEDAQRLFQGLLKNNYKVENPIHWLGFKRYLKGELKGSGIWELEFFSGVQYRVLGFFGPRRKEATLLIGCYHKQKIYEPPNALKTALKRKEMLEEGIATYRERKIRTDI